MCNLSWTPNSNLEKDNSLNHSCVSPKMGCLEYTNYRTKNDMTQTQLIIPACGPVRKTNSGHTWNQ